MSNQVVNQEVNQEVDDLTTRVGNFLNPPVDTEEEKGLSEQEKKVWDISLEEFRNIPLIKTDRLDVFNQEQVEIKPFTDIVKKNIYPLRYLLKNSPPPPDKINFSDIDLTPEQEAEIREAYTKRYNFINYSIQHYNQILKRETLFNQKDYDAKQTYYTWYRYFMQKYKGDETSAIRDAVNKAYRVLSAKEYFLEYKEKYDLDIESFNPSNPFRSFVNWFYDIKDTPMTVVDPSVSRDYYETASAINYGHIDLGRNDIPKEEKNNIIALSKILDESLLAQKTFLKDLGDGLKTQSNFLMGIAEGEKNEEAIKFLKKASHLINKTNYDVGIMFGDENENVLVGAIDILGSIVNHVTFGAVEAIEGLFRDGVTTIEDGAIQEIDQTIYNNKAIKILNQAVEEGIDETKYNTTQRAAKMYLDALGYRGKYKEEYENIYTPSSMEDRYKNDVSSMFGFIAELIGSSYIFRYALKGINILIGKVAPRLAMESTFIKNAQPGSFLQEALQVKSTAGARFKYVMVESAKGAVPFVLASTLETTAQPMFYQILAQNTRDKQEIASLPMVDDEGVIKAKDILVDSYEKRQALYDNVRLLHDEALREKQNRDLRHFSDYIKGKNIIEPLESKFSKLNYDELSAIAKNYESILIQLCEPGYSGIKYIDDYGVEHNDKPAVVRKDLSTFSKIGNSFYSTSIESNSERIGGLGISTLSRHYFNRLSIRLGLQQSTTLFGRTINYLGRGSNTTIQNVGGWYEEAQEEVTAGFLEEFNLERFKYGMDYWFENFGTEVGEVLTGDVMSSLVNPMATKDVALMFPKIYKSKFKKHFKPKKNNP